MCYYSSRLQAYKQKYNSGKAWVAGLKWDWHGNFICCDSCKATRRSAPYYNWQKTKQPFSRLQYKRLCKGVTRALGTLEVRVYLHLYIAQDVHAEGFLTNGRLVCIHRAEREEQVHIFQKDNQKEHLISDFITLNKLKSIVSVVGIVVGTINNLWAGLSCTHASTLMMQRISAVIQRKIWSIINRSIHAKCYLTVLSFLRQAKTALQHWDRQHI